MTRQLPDDPFAGALETVIRTARKSWPCDGNGANGAARVHALDCPMTIAPGERYVEYLGETPAYQSGSRHSAACALEFHLLDPTQETR